MGGGREVLILFKKVPPTKRLVLATILAVFSAILQAAGGLLPGIGFLISPFSTLTVLLAVLLSFRYGLLSYLLTILLLVFIEPGELLVFPFTTGLLGLTLGWTLLTFKKRFPIIVINGIVLTAGICTALYGLKFSVLGPLISTVPAVAPFLVIYAFALSYSWFWLELSLFFLGRIKKILSQTDSNISK